MPRSNLLAVLAEIRERLAAASPAPWTVETDSNGVNRLVSALDGKQRSVTIEELDMIDAVASRATAGPWTAFIEEVQPIGGPSVIWVGGDDDPDMYLWLGTKIAPPGDVNFVAHAREDVPALVAAIKARLRGTSDKRLT